MTVLKKVAGVALFTLMCLGFVSCNSEDSVNFDAAPASVKTRVLVSGVISSNTTWYSNTDYQLDGKVYVSNGATLTIQAGTKIEGLPSATPDSASALVITRGSKINAVGTAANPIVFTAANGVKGGWGGLVLLGKAVNNQGTNVLIEGIDPQTVPAGVDVYYGGTDDSDNSGVLSYVRVEYAGAAIAANNELNSFTFGSVGSGTQLDHLQAYQGADDAFEFFGGTVNAKYLLSTAADDDAFDFDFGYRGKLQFLVSVIDPALNYSSNPNGIESDNDASEDDDNTPFTHPVISNITIAGTVDGAVAGGGDAGYLKDAAHLRRKTSFTIVNAIFYGYPNGLHNDNANASFTLLTNVGTAFNANSTYLNFSGIDASNISVAAPGNLVLTSPFGSYKSGGLTPLSGDADAIPYDAKTLDAFFDTPDIRGGANDPLGFNWLNATWVR
jgi:hypothetical protein